MIDGIRYFKNEITYLLISIIIKATYLYKTVSTWERERERLTFRSPPPSKKNTVLEMRNWNGDQTCCKWDSVSNFQTSVHKYVSRELLHQPLLGNGKQCMTFYEYQPVEVMYSIQNNHVKYENKHRLFCLCLSINCSGSCFVVTSA